MRIYRLKLTFLFICIFGLLSCAQKTNDLAIFVSETKKNSVSKIEPLPEYIPYKKFVYESEDVRDPFIPESVIQALEEEQQNDEFAPDTTRKKEPLEAFPLDTLQMVGTLEKDDQWALIRTSEGIVHRVKVGNYLGQNHGVIINLDESKIVIKETIKDGIGKWVERTSKLSLGE